VVPTPTAEPAKSPERRRHSVFQIEADTADGKTLCFASGGASLHKLRGRRNSELAKPSPFTASPRSDEADPMAQIRPILTNNMLKKIQQDTHYHRSYSSELAISQNSHYSENP